jgi:hypothetical protein
MAALFMTGRSRTAIAAVTVGYHEVFVLLWDRYGTRY